MSTHIGAGAVAGLLAGVVFGMMMHVMDAPTPGGGQMPMIAMAGQIVGSPTIVAGWLYHLFNSVVIGAILGWVLGERTREIAVRIALGANRRQVLALVVGQSVVVAAAGILLGLDGGAALARYLDQLLFGLSALDPLTFAAVAVLSFAIALAAAFVPARRATRIEPATGLRMD